MKDQYNKFTKKNFESEFMSFDIDAHTKEKDRANNRRESKYRDKNKYDNDYYDTKWN